MEFYCAWQCISQQAQAIYWCSVCNLHNKWDLLKRSEEHKFTKLQQTFVIKGDGMAKISKKFWSGINNKNKVLLPECKLLYPWGPYSLSSTASIYEQIKKEKAIFWKKKQYVENSFIVPSNLLKHLSSI